MAKVYFESAKLRKEKLDEIIKEYNKIYENWLDAIDCNIGTLVKRTTEKLEKFRDSEL